MRGRMVRAFMGDASLVRVYMRRCGGAGAPAGEQVAGLLLESRCSTGCLAVRILHSCCVPITRVKIAQASCILYSALFLAIGIRASYCRVGVQHRLPRSSKPVPGKVIGGSALAESGPCERPRTVLFRARLAGGDRMGVRTRCVLGAVSLVWCSAALRRLRPGRAHVRRGGVLVNNDTGSGDDGKVGTLACRGAGEYYGRPPRK